MKNLFTYLKALGSSMVNSQKSDMRHDCRLTVGSPSGLDAKWKQKGHMEQKGKMSTSCLSLASYSPLTCLLQLRYAAMVLFILTIGVGNVWGATQSFDPSTDKGTITKNGTSAGDSFTKNGFTISSSNGVLGNGSNYRVYTGGTFSISSSVGTITAISFTFSSTYTGGLSSSYTGLSTTSWSANATSQARITAITVTYTPSAASHTLSSAVSPAASGSVELSATSVAEGSTATATATPATHYVFDHWSISGTGSTLSSTTANPTTITMGTANTTVTATFVAAPKASITLSEAGATTTDATTYYVGDSYTLPSTTEASCGTKVLVGWSTIEVAETDTKPTSNYYEKGASVTLAATQTFYAVFATESGGDPVTISGGDMASSLPSGWSSDGTDGFYSNNGVKFNSTGDYILSGNISSHGLTSVTVKFKAGYNGDEGSVLRIEAIDEEGYEIGGVNFTPTETYDHQNTVNTVVVNASGTIYRVAVEMTEKTSNVGVKYCEVFKGGTTYSAYSTSCEACTANPTRGSAALKGGFSLSSVGVTATGWDAGTNCSWTDYGFVWGTSANPTVSDNKVQVGNSGTTTTWDGTLTGSFTVSTTYYFRAYGKNGKDGGAVQYSDDATFTPRQVSFNMHGHGGDAPANQVVNNGGKATDPGDPSEAGWTFGGWYNNDSYTGSAWVFSTNTVSGGNVTLHAKWTEKPKYTITLNAGNGTVSEAGWEKDGDVWKQQQSNGDASITFPSASSNCAGWEFVGWATSAANNVSSDPTSKAAGATLVPASNVTYYAVYRQSSAGGTTYSKITSAGDLTTGNYVITGMYNGTTPYKMDGSLYNEGVSLGESSASVTDGSLTESTASYVWTIIKFGSSVVFRNTSTSKFLAIVDGKFALQDEGQLFTYSVTSGAWTFTSPSGKQIIYATRYNVGDSQNREIHLYKQGSTPSGNFYTNPTCSDLSITGVADPAAGGSVTLSATSAKSGEKVYAYYTADDDYNFTSWSISGTGSTLSSTSAQFTEITVGTANTTVTANFAAKDWKTVTWKANGEALTGGDLGSASVKVENGYDITAMPPTPASCDGTSTNFIGWVAESDIWSGKTNDVSGVTIYEKIADFPTVTDNVVYHAVWAKKTGGSGNETLTCSAGTVVSNTMTFSTTNYTIIHKKNDSGATMAAYSPWRVYEKNTVEISGSMTITGLDIVHSGTYYGVLQSNKGTLTLANSSGGTTTVRGIDATEVIITNKSGAAQSQWTSIKIYYDNSTYSQYLVKCCNTPTLTFAASPYAVLREDIQGASTTTWAEVDVTFTSNNTTGTISVPDYGSSKSVYKLSAWESRATTGGTLCTTDQAYLEVLTQPKGATPGTGKFHVKTTSGQTGQGTYRIAITQEATDESHGNFCETTVYGFVDVTLRDKFVDNVNGNGTINRNGHGAQLATPTLSEFGTQEEDACHSEGRKLKGWIKETDLKAQYETGNSTRVQTVDGLCETCADGTDQTSLIVAPGANVTMSGATWYAVWAYEK